MLPRPLPNGQFRRFMPQVCWHRMFKFPGDVHWLTTFVLNKIYRAKIHKSHSSPIFIFSSLSYKQKKSFAIFSHLEKLAGDTGIRSKILYMKPTVSTPSDAYEEESVEIKMEGVTLEQIIRYLYQVENSPQFLKIKRLYIRPRLDNRQLLTATFRVSTFTPKQGAA